MQLAQVVAQLLALTVLAQLRQSLSLNLTNALARHAKFLTHFFERVRAAVFQTKPHPQDRGYASLKFVSAPPPLMVTKI